MCNIVVVINFIADLHHHGVTIAIAHPRFHHRPREIVFGGDDKWLAIHVSE
jgi:hypothetical protein